MNEAVDRHFRRKVAAFLTLQRPESAFLDTLLAAPREVGRSAALLNQGNPLDTSFVLLRGWCMRFKSLSDGRRQVLGIVLPGDLFGLEAHLLTEATATVTALTPCMVSEFRVPHLVRLIEEQPRLASSLMWMTAREEAFLGERLLSVGRQSAFERVAHFLIELYHRLRLIGFAADGRFDFPLTLEIVADALGMSMVHVSRTMQVLRREGLAARTGRQVHILDPERLEIVSDFSGLYLGRRLGERELFLQPKFELAGKGKA